jgi:hypothetical protein
MRLTISPSARTKDGLVFLAPVGDGDVVVPMAMQAVITQASDDETDPLPVVTVTLDVEVVDRVPLCTRFQVEGSPAHPVTKRLLGQMSPEQWAGAVVALCAVTTPPDSPTFQSVIDDMVDGEVRMLHIPLLVDPEAGQDAVEQVRRRRTVTPTRLAQVAAAYQRGGAAAVARESHISRAQAFRLVRQARDAGYLPLKEQKKP